MDNDLKKVPARFYRSESGAEPVREWLSSLDREARLEIGTDIATVEYGWPVQGHMILLHAFIKKTQKTPKTDLELARARQKEIER